MADVLAVAFSHLNRRELTIAELRAKLARTRFSESDVDRAVAELTELGYLDDARFARVFTQDKRELQQWGRERIAIELARRGIDRELVDATLSGRPDEQEQEKKRAVALLLRRFPRHGDPDRRQRERAYGVLVRKGYDGELASDAVRTWSQLH